MSLYLGQTRLSANRGSYGVLKKNLANIDTEGIDYLLNSKSILSGDIGSNSSVYNNILNYKHSTFDKSKFKVAGSPTITEDGVASGFSDTNKITIASDFVSANSWVFYSPTFQLNELGSIENYVIHSSSICISKNYNTVPENSQFIVRLYFSDETEVKIYYFSDITIVENENYQVKIEYTGTQYKIYIKVGDGNYVLKHTITKSAKLISNTDYTIGSFGMYGWYNGSIDLKSFAIRADGIPVFNGNKTGLDVIKEDNYEVIGSPVITEDGIASGFTNNDYIITNGSTSGFFECFFKFITKDVASPQMLMYENQTGVSLSRIHIYNNKLIVNFSSDGTSFDISDTYASALTLDANVEYVGKFSFNGSQYKIDLSKNNEPFINYITLDSTQQMRATTWILGKQYGNIGALDGSIDLNAFKIYVDGNLVYQPCLKIPYTESKTGSKIVDSIYRQRISDLYELQGYAPYYSLDEQNQTYTLPKGEVYGMINKYGNEYTKSHITNTIFNTSNNINLVNSNGNLVLKAGSIIYFPNGFEEDGVTRKFITKTIPSDKTIIYEATNRKNLVICLTASLTTILTYDYECYSSTDGTTPPSSVNRRVWYDMQNNVIKTYSPDSDTAETELISFPIALVDTVDTANKFSISKVFNSVGYIDKCLFTLPDIQLLCPNGIKDNSLNNNIITIKDIIVNNREDNLTGTYNLRISPREIIATAVQYDYHNNVNSLDDKLYKDSTIIGTVEYASGRIINLNYSDTLSLVHYGNFSDALSKNICTTSPISSTGNYTCTSYKPAVVIYNYVNGKSWYRLYSDGYCEQGGETEVFQSNTQKTISLLKQLIADNYQVNLIQIMSTDSPTCSTVNFITQRNSDSFTINYTTWGSEYPQIKYLWEAKGYIQ